MAGVGRGVVGGPAGGAAVVRGAVAVVVAAGAVIAREPAGVVAVGLALALAIDHREGKAPRAPARERLRVDLGRTGLPLAIRLLQRSVVEAVDVAGGEHREQRDEGDHEPHRERSVQAEFLDARR